MKGWKRDTFRMLLCMVAVCVSGVLTPVSVRAGTLYESSYVSWTQDRFAWTVKEGISNAPIYYELEGSRPEYWYPKGDRVETGIPSSLRALREGEHYYTVKITGEVPIKYWEVEWSEGKCIHDCTVEEWHGVENKGPKEDDGSYSGEHCDRAYYSGWTAYCADCGGKLNTSIVYMSKEAAGTITSVDTGKGYYYSCPSCFHIENTMGPIAHECKAISFNQYRVVYDKNDNGSNSVGGFMDDSYHMYNNEDVYQGQMVTPIGRLSKNVYTRTGYAFKGWNTKADGTGESYEDCAKILNLSLYNYADDNIRGTVTLYAQWEKSESTLQIDLNGGTYNDPQLEAQGGSYDRTTGIVMVRKSYGQTYNARKAYVNPPAGYKVKFNTGGGDTISAMTQQQKFTGWTLVSNPFRGRWKDNTYAFVGPNGFTDTIKANYSNDSIILPEPTKEGYSFGGWYRDKKHTILVGFAGDTFKATEDITLYAKWVELVLSSKENYTDNGGKGAVDLIWSQPDNRNKTYQVYRAKGNGAFSPISSTGDEMETHKVDKSFAYKDEYDTDYKTVSYTVTHSGFYELSASGAQGGGYGSKTGGKGGRVTGKFYLSAGEKLTIALGGKGGTADDSQAAAGGNGGYKGGKGNKYGSGGGATTITSDRQGLLLVAGGGGGASPSGNGGKGGATEAGRTDGKHAGELGQAGGGGGYVGGSNGSLNIHNCTDACYHTEDTSYRFENFVGYASFRSNNMYDYDMDTEEDLYSAGTGQVRVGGHTKDADRPFFEINLGSRDKTIPVNGNTSLTIPLYSYLWGDGDGFDSGAYLKVFDQNENVLKTFKLKDHTTSRYGDRDNSNQFWIAKNTSTGTPREFQVDLPEGTTGVSVKLYLWVEHVENGGDNEGLWVEAKMEALKFSGGVSRTKICGYTDGQVLSSGIGYGGSNYVNSNAISSTQEQGVRSGNGRASIQSEIIGFLTELSLTGVWAPDEKGPAAISTDSSRLTLRAEGQNGVKVTFKRPGDGGTSYRFQVESYEEGEEEVLCTSNETEETLKTGVAGYYYVLDRAAETAVTADNATNKRRMLSSVGTTETLTVELTADEMYLHIAAVDKAGNMGNTAHIPLKRKEIPGGVATGQTKVTDVVGGREYGSVYPQDDTTYYVRSDGETPFLLSFPSYLSGVATGDYQIDYQIFDVTMDTLNQRYSTRLPISNPVCEEEEELEVLDFIREVTGDSILKDAMNTSAVRKQNATENGFSQAFTVPVTYHGRTFMVTPVAGVTNNREGDPGRGEIVFSDWNDDITHGVTLIADGEGPVISGMELLTDPEGIRQNEGTLSLQIAANDGLSGVKEFWVEVSNQNNSSSQIYEPEGDVIRLEITGEDSLYNGDFVVKAYAMDHVGNETIVSGGLTEFSLTAAVERILAPHEPLFKRGESGMLFITVCGYADKIEVEFPEIFVQHNPGLNQTWTYMDSPQYKIEETIQFMVPLEELAEEEYKVTVRAYKNEQVLEDSPELYIISTGSVTEELRTRLR